MQAVQHTVPIEIVAAISQRTHSVVQLPEEVEQVLGKHLGGGSKKGLRADSQALLQELRSRSRSTSRGGVNELRLSPTYRKASQSQLPQKKVRPGHVQDMIGISGCSSMLIIADHANTALPSIDS